MTRTRITLATSALLACVVFLQSAILTLYGYGYDVASASAFDAAPGNAQNSQEILPFLPGILVSDLVVAAGFGIGVFVALRLIRSIAADLVWKRVVIRGILATAVGSVAVLVVRLLETLLTSVTIGPFPLGYSLTPSFDSGNVQLGVANALGQLINPFVDFVPLVVLGCVFLKLWLAAHPSSVEAKAPASVSA
jgi:hypothetical protein